MTLLWPGNTRLVVPFTGLPLLSFKLSSGMAPTDKLNVQDGLSDNKLSTLMVAATRTDTAALADNVKGMTALEAGARLSRDIRDPFAWIHSAL